MTIYLRSALLGATALLAFSTGARADCGEVTITEMNWASATVVTACPGIWCRRTSTLMSPPARP